MRVSEGYWTASSGHSSSWRLPFETLARKVCLQARTRRIGHMQGHAVSRRCVACYSELVRRQLCGIARHQRAWLQSDVHGRCVAQLHFTASSQLQQRPLLLAAPVRASLYADTLARLCKLIRSRAHAASVRSSVARVPAARVATARVVTRTLRIVCSRCHQVRSLFKAFCVHRALGFHLCAPLRFLAG